MTDGISRDFESSDSVSGGAAGPLSGVRVLELGQFIAGPYAGSMLAYFGADVIKIEPPGKGDPLRQWREVQNGTSLWWHSIARNKKSVTIDLRRSEGQELVRQLAQKADILIENFRPGVMERWGLGPEELKPINPGLIYTRVSGYGQTGPNSQKPGFASVCEGFSGFRYVNGFPDQAPVRPNLSIGDTIAGMHAVIGALMALVHRQKQTEEAGQVVDVALYESMFNLMEAVVPEYSGAGKIRQPSGTTVTGIVPTNTYRCADERYVIIGANSDQIFRRLMIAIDRPDLADDSRLAHNPGRVSYEAELDQVIGSWCGERTAQSVIDQLEQNAIPVGPIYSIEDIFDDPHYQQRGMLETRQVDGRELTIPGYAPKLSATPGETRWTGPELGAHNREILQSVLGLSESEIRKMAEPGIIGRED
jgi:crotonobetainyl-CoA:carnitine CoA-transferase CaiB-like acyl-CoA transferase